jgi:mono/diheme cytochrome c family protein
MRRASRLAAALPVVLALAGGACGLLPQRSAGEQLWRDLCADCHGVDGRGNTPRYMGKPYADVVDNVWRGDGDPATVAQIVREGVFGEMPGNPDLTAEEMTALLDWFYGLRGEESWSDD